MALSVGTFRAKAVSGALGFDGKNNAQVVVSFRFLEGPNLGVVGTWYGSFSGKAEARTLESLRFCGWAGDDLSNLVGIDANEVLLVVGEDTFNGKTSTRIEWVNEVGAVRMKAAMTPEQAKEFAKRMMGQVLASKKATPPKTAATTPAAPPSDTNGDVDIFE